jgi:hypothetical protein
MSRNAGRARRWRMVSRRAGSRAAARLSIDRTGVGARAGSCSSRWTSGVGGRVPRQLRGRCADAGDGVNAREQRWLGEHRSRGGVGAAAEVRFWWSTSCLFFSNEGGSLSAPLHPPKRIAPGIGEQRRKQRKEQAANYYSGMMEDVIAAAYAAVLVAAGSWMVHCQQAWNWRE